MAYQHISWIVQKSKWKIPVHFQEHPRRSDCSTRNARKKTCTFPRASWENRNLCRKTLYILNFQEHPTADEARSNIFLIGRYSNSHQRESVPTDNDNDNDNDCMMMKLFAKLALPSAVGSHQSGLGFGCMGITSFYGR
jgi:hypothetical protein